MLEDSYGILWVGTAEGLNRFNPKEDNFKRFIHDNKKPTSLSNNHIKSIYEDKDGCLWIGTTGGLNKFNRKTGTFIHYREKHGLANDVIYSILQDSMNNLWLGTNQGISKFEVSDNTFKNFDINDGLQSNEFNTGVCAQGINNEMFFGGINGFNAFYPDKIDDNRHISPIVLTGFQKFNQKVKLDVPISEIKQMELSYKDYVFSFSFSALDYTSPEKNMYAFKMEGFDKEWQNIGNSRHFTVYTNLYPGQYTFRVRGSNNNGIWNKKGTWVNITILPPWWQTLWLRKNSSF